MLIKLLIYGNTTSLQLISRSVNRTSSLFRVDQRVSADEPTLSGVYQELAANARSYFLYRRHPICLKRRQSTFRRLAELQQTSCLVVINTELVAERGRAAVNFTRSIKWLVSPYILT